MAWGCKCGTALNNNYTLSTNPPAAILSGRRICSHCCTQKMVYFIAVITSSTTGICGIFAIRATPIRTHASIAALGAERSL